jgi:fimbrial chaperone protein
MKQARHEYFSSRSPALAGALLALTLAVSASPSLAGEFAVSPVRLDLDRNAKTGVVTVSNDAQEKLQVQMQLFEWTQDADGKDHYEPSSDLVFFPKVMSLKKGEQKLIRAGFKVPATTTEKTYRLFIEEIPEPKVSEGQGATINVAIRFGVPIFLKPQKEESRGELTKVAVAQNKLAIAVNNTGNQHFIIKTIAVQSGDSFRKEINGWYLLAGAARTYSVDIPADVCKSLAKLDVNIKTDKLELSRSVDVTPEMCQQ